MEISGMSLVGTRAPSTDISSTGSRSRSVSPAGSQFMYFADGHQEAVAQPSYESTSRSPSRHYDQSGGSEDEAEAGRTAAQDRLREYKLKKEREAYEKIEREKQLKAEKRRQSLEFVELLKKKEEAVHSMEEEEERKRKKRKHRKKKMLRTASIMMGIVGLMEDVTEQEQEVEEPDPEPKVIVEDGFLVEVTRVSEGGASRFGRGEGRTWQVYLDCTIPLNKALLRVGFHFGLTTGDRMFGGRQGTKIMWERPRWRFSYMMPFFDPRLPEYSVEKVALDADEDWMLALGDKPWTTLTMRTKALEYLSAKINSQDPEMQEEGSHAMWEFTVHVEHHASFTSDMIALLLGGLASNSIRARVNSAYAIWSLMKTKHPRRLVVEAGGVERLLSVLSLLPHLQNLGERMDAAIEASSKAGKRQSGHSGRNRAMLLRAGTHNDRVALQASCTGALCSMLCEDEVARLRFLNPMPFGDAVKGAGGQLALVTPIGAWKTLASLACVPSPNQGALDQIMRVTRTFQADNLRRGIPSHLVAAVVPEMAGGAIAKILHTGDGEGVERVQAHEALAAAGGVHLLAVLLESTKWVARAAASALHHYVLQPNLEQLRAMPYNVYNEVFERVLRWLLRWVRVVEPDEGVDMRVPGRSPPADAPRPYTPSATSFEPASVTPPDTMQETAEGLVVLLWALCMVDADADCSMTDTLLAGLVEVGGLVASRLQLCSMASPLAATFFRLVSHENYAHRLMDLGILPVLLNLIKMPLAPVQERVIASLGILASYTHLSYSQTRSMESRPASPQWRLSGTPCLPTPHCMFGPHRETMVEGGAIGAIASSGLQWEQNPRIKEVASAALMWLCTEARGRPTEELEGVLKMLQSKRSTAVMHAAAAVWCLVADKRHRTPMLQCEALSYLVQAAEDQLVLLNERPSPTVITAHHFIVAAFGVLLLHQVHEMTGLRSNSVHHGRQGLGFSDSRFRVYKHLQTLIRVPRFVDPPEALGMLSTKDRRGSYSGTIPPQDSQTDTAATGGGLTKKHSLTPTAGGVTRNFSTASVGSPTTPTARIPGTPKTPAALTRSTPFAKPENHDQWQEKWQEKFSKHQLETLEAKMQKVRNCCLMLLYSIAITVQGAFSELMEGGTARTLVAFVQDTRADVEARAVAITALQGMCSHQIKQQMTELRKHDPGGEGGGEGSLNFLEEVKQVYRTTLRQMYITEGTLEELHTGLLRSKHVVLEERGAKGCAHLSMHQSSRAMLAACGSTELLIQLASRAYPEDGSKGTTPQATLIMSLMALLNMSLNKDVQVIIGQRGLKVLLALNKHGPWSHQVVMLTSGILHNVSKHASNRTVLYREELREKSLAAESAVVMGDDGPLDGMKYLHVKNHPCREPEAFLAGDFFADHIVRRDSVCSQAHSQGTSHAGGSYSQIGGAGSERSFQGSGGGGGVSGEVGGSPPHLSRLGSGALSSSNHPDTSRPSTSQVRMSELPRPVSQGVLGGGGGGGSGSSPSRPQTQGALRPVTVGAKPRGGDKPFPGVGREHSAEFTQWLQDGFGTAQGEGSVAASSSSMDFLLNSTREPVPNLRHLMKGPMSCIWQEITLDSHTFSLAEHHPGGGRIDHWKPKVRDVEWNNRKGQAKIERAGFLDLAGAMRGDVVRLDGGPQRSSEVFPSHPLMKNLRAEDSGAVLGLGGPGRSISPVSAGFLNPDGPGQLKDSKLVDMRNKLGPLRLPGAGGDTPSPALEEEDSGWRLSGIQKFRMQARKAKKNAGTLKSMNEDKASVKKVGLTIKLGKARGRNDICFSGVNKDKTQVERLDLFMHVPGAKTCQDLFHHVRMPDGSYVHVFEHKKQLVDEVKLPWDPPPAPPTSLAAALLTQLPEYDFTRQLGQLIPTRLTHRPYKPFIVSAPWPDKHTLNIEPHTCVDPSVCPKHGSLVPITPALELECSIHTTLEHARVEEVHEWHLGQSVFVQRSKTSDSRDYTDGAKLINRMLDNDLRRAFNKKRFVRLLMGNTHGGGDAVAELKKLHAVLKDHYRVIVNSFYYYAAIDGAQDIHQMQGSEWLRYLTECGVPNDKTGFCKRHDCDRIFIETNFVDASDQDQGQRLNKKDALMRFEFIEGLVRVAIAKYQHRASPVKVQRVVSVGGAAGKRISQHQECDVSEYMGRLLKEHILPGIPKECRLDRDEFRKDRLYNEEVDMVFRRHLSALQNVYNFYKLLGVQRVIGAGGRNEVFEMSMAEFMFFLKDSQMMDQGDSVDVFSVREARLMFIWSRMLVIDEWSGYRRMNHLSFPDFLEALARTADCMGYPTEEELEEWGKENGLQHRLQEKGDPIPSLREYFEKVNAGCKPIPKRPSAGVFSKRTRPLTDKLHQLLAHMFEGLCLTHGTSSTGALIRKLQYLAKNHNILGNTHI